MSDKSDSSSEQASSPSSISERQISSTHSFVSTHCWKIVDFKKQWMEARNNGKKRLTSDTFPLILRPHIRFTFEFESAEEVWSRNWHGLTVKDFGGNKTVEIGYKFWFENEKGQKFNMLYELRQIFDQTNISWGWTGLSKENAASLDDLYDKHGTLYFYCQITDSNPIVEDDHEKFYMNQWALFEREEHDAIIKVGGVEFKIMKTYFIAQSEVFASMFSSSFKEGQTNVVEAKDVSEKTMKALIKWLYTGRIEKENLDEDLFEATDKYDIKLLKKLCGDHLCSTMGKENVIWRLKIAVMHSESKLKDSALSYIAQMPGVEMAQMLTDSKWTAVALKNVNIFNEVNKLINDKMSGLKLK